MGLEETVSRLQAATNEVLHFSKIWGRLERLALTGEMALVALSADPEHTSPREAADMISQHVERSAEYDRAEAITNALRPGCHILSEVTRLQRALRELNPQGDAASDRSAGGEGE